MLFSATFHAHELLTAACFVSFIFAFMCPYLLRSRTVVKRMAMVVDRHWNKAAAHDIRPTAIPKPQNRNFWLIQSKTQVWGTAGGAAGNIQSHAAVTKYPRHAPPCPTRARWLSPLPLCCSWGPAQACRCARPTEWMPLKQRTPVARKDCVSGPPRPETTGETVVGSLPTKGTNTNHQSACEKGLFTFCGVSAWGAYFMINIYPEGSEYVKGM